MIFTVTTDMLAIDVSVASLIGTVLVIRYLNRVSGDYETYEWTVTEIKEKATAALLPGKWQSSQHDRE